MQGRMKNHQLNAEQITDLLNKTDVGTLATLNSDGTPYATPVHFVYDGEAIYFHGLPVGQKLSNIEADPRVSFTAYNMDGLLYDESGHPCETNTKYQSVIIQGRAKKLTDLDQKRAVLGMIIRKYTPHQAENPFSDARVRGTAVVKITIDAITGKYYE